MSPREAKPRRLLVPVNRIVVPARVDHVRGTAVAGHADPVVVVWSEEAPLPSVRARHQQLDVSYHEAESVLGRGTRSDSCDAGN